MQRPVAAECACGVCICGTGDKESAGVQDSSGLCLSVLLFSELLYGGLITEVGSLIRRLLKLSMWTRTVALHPGLSRSACRIGLSCFWFKPVEIRTSQPFPEREGDPSTRSKNLHRKSRLHLGTLGFTREPCCLSGTMEFKARNAHRMMMNSRSAVMCLI